MTEPKPKKSLWDIIDSWLPTATTVYGKIREGKTGVNPYEPDSGFVENNEDMSVPDENPMPYMPDNIDINDDGKKPKTLLYVLGGVGLIGLGVGTYFLIKKIKK